MEQSVASFLARLRQPWLTCESTQQLVRERFARCCELLKERPPQSVCVIACTEAADSLAATIAALATATPAFIANPQWTPGEKAQAQTQIALPQLWISDALCTQITDGTTATSTATESAHTYISVQAHAHTSTSRHTDTNVDTHTDTNANTSAPPAGRPSADSLHGCLFIPTGGTGGRLKFACHSFETLSAATAGYSAFWGMRELNCICTLPVFHIGGLMLALRSFLSGGRLWLLPWEQLRQCAQTARMPAPETAGANNADKGNNAQALHWHISLVPTQLSHLLPHPAACNWLRALGAVLTGGGATALPLLRQVAALGIPLSPAYGMTESAATIALQRPLDFLRQYAQAQPQSASPVHSNTQEEADSPAEANCWQTLPAQQPPLGEVLPHLRVRIEAGTDTTADAAQGQAAPCAPTAEPVPLRGRIILEGKSLFLGYYPHAPQRQESFATTDLGALHGGSMPLICKLQVLGRLDRVIISGGKKVDPALVEQAIREAAAAIFGNKSGRPQPAANASGAGADAAQSASALPDVFVCGMADQQWGERVVAFIAGAGIRPTANSATAAHAPTTLHSGNKATLPESLRTLAAAVAAHLPAYQRPKQWIAVAALPLDARGKPDHTRIRALCASSAD